MIENIYKIYSQPLSDALYTLSKSDLRIGSSDPKSFGQALLNSSKRRRK
jgi:hypothetical protein